jgi:hypothetical protein
MQFADASHGANLSAGEIEEEILQVLFEFVERLAFGKVIRVFFEVSQPVGAVLPVDEANGGHCIYSSWA